MRKGVKISLWISLCLVLSGILFVGIGGAMMGFDFTKLDTATYIERNETVNEPFTEIEIDCDSADVTVLPSSDGVCRVESKLNRNFAYSLTVENGRLRIAYEADAWYRHLHIHLVKTYITVYLPAEQYESLKIDLISGEIAVQDLKVEKLSIENVSGDIETKNCGVGTAKISTVSGDIGIEDLVAKGAITLDCTSGDIEFSRMDGAELRIETVSGDVEGSLLSNKHFIAKSTSGDIHIPDSDSSAGKCVAKTTSGDIEIKIVK